MKNSRPRFQQPVGCSAPCLGHVPHPRACFGFASPRTWLLSSMVRCLKERPGCRSLLAVPPVFLLPPLVRPRIRRWLLRYVPVVPRLCRVYDDDSRCSGRLHGGVRRGPWAASSHRGVFPGRRRLRGDKNMPWSTYSEYLILLELVKKRLYSRTLNTRFYWVRLDLGLILDMVGCWAEDRLDI